MDVAIIGKGTAAIVTTLHLLKNNHRVTIFYDPKTEPINVGESSTPPFVDLIYDTLQISMHDLVNEGIFSYKSGINFVNWGSGKQFYHNFYNQKTSVHFETKSFNEYIHKFLESNNLVKYVGKKIDEFQYDYSEWKVIVTEGLKYDFVVCCSGWGNDGYEKPIIETVNSGILFKKSYEEYSNHHTLHLATEDGWQFGLPFPKQDTFKCGYLYNNKLISKEKVIEKVSSMEGSEIYDSFSWTPKYSTTMIKNFFLATNGNRLFFFEPLQALSLHYFIDLAEKICNFLDNRSEYEMDRINSVYRSAMYEKQMTLAYHYHFGSSYDSEYWNKIKEKSTQLMEGSYWGLETKFYMKVNNDIKYNLKADLSSSKLGIFEWQDHKYIINGMIPDSNILYKSGCKSC